MIFFIKKNEVYDISAIIDFLFSILFHIIIVWDKAEYSVSDYPFLK